MRLLSRRKAPDLIEPIQGYRLWKRSGDDLYSPIVDTLLGFTGVKWSPNEALEARCIAKPRALWHPRSVAPTKSCRCGIYAAKDDKTLATYIRTQGISSSVWCGYFVVGKVALWGIVQEHEFVYRAQFARIVKLFKVSPADPPTGYGEVVDAWTYSPGARLWTGLRQGYARIDDRPWLVF